MLFRKFLFVPQDYNRVYRFGNRLGLLYLQSEYKDMDFSPEICCNDNDISGNIVDADKLLMRSIKMNVPTLDKYVTRTSTKKKDEIILPKQKNINLNEPELKNKGLKKNNITNIYEDKKTKKTDEEK